LDSKRIRSSNAFGAMSKSKAKNASSGAKKDASGKKDVTTKAASAEALKPRLSDAEFAIPVAEIDAGGKGMTFPIRVSWLRGVLEDTGVAAPAKDGELTCRVSKSGNDLVIHGRLEASLSAPCARCLNPASVDVAKKIAFMAVPSSQLRQEAAANQEDIELAEEDEIIGYDNDVLVLDEWLRDELLLEVPMFPLCSEACPGMVPLPSAQLKDAKDAKEVADLGEDDLHVDHRLRPLLALRNQLKTQKKS
jgi:uncharacterized protein